MQCYFNENANTHLVWKSKPQQATAAMLQPCSRGRHHVLRICFHSARHTYSHVHFPTGHNQQVVLFYQIFHV